MTRITNLTKKSFIIATADMKSFYSRNDINFGAITHQMQIENRFSLAIHYSPVFEDDISKAERKPWNEIVDLVDIFFFQRFLAKSGRPDISCTELFDQFFTRYIILEYDIKDSTVSTLSLKTAREIYYACLQKMFLSYLDNVDGYENLRRPLVEREIFDSNFKLSLDKAVLIIGSFNNRKETNPIIHTCQQIGISYKITKRMIYLSDIEQATAFLLISLNDSDSYYWHLDLRNHTENFQNTANHFEKWLMNNYND